MKYGAKLYPDEVAGLISPLSTGKVLFVDGDKSTGGAGSTWEDAYATIQAVETASSAGDVILVAERTMAKTDTDPISYAETVVIDTPSLSIIGVSRGRTQGGLPQVKIGAGSTAMFTVRAPGCLIANLGFNGVSSTGGGILLDDDGGSTKSAFGTTIVGCHFKNCKAHTTNGTLGGGIYWSSAGGAWQVLIEGNTFYKNVADIVLVGTTGSVPQDVVIRNNIFSGPATSVDVNLYLAGGSGISSVTVEGNIFPSVLPALTSGSVVRYADLTGCTGIFANNYFGGVYTTTGFGAAKAAAKIPTTVGLPHNYTDGGLVVREA